MNRNRCFFTGWPDLSPCEGALVRAHLIPRQELRKAFPRGAWDTIGIWLREPPFADEGLVVGNDHGSYKTLRQLCDDERTWIPVCGGLVGIDAHHGQLDSPLHSLKLTRDQLPAGVEEFAVEFGLGRVLDRLYGEKVTVA